MNKPLTASEIKETAQHLGFFRSGITKIEPFPLLNHLEKWLDEGKHGEMAWMKKNAENRLDPLKILPEARSMLVVAMNYYVPGNAETAEGGKIARYALGEDYHEVMEKRMMALTGFIRSRAPEARTKVYVDTGPIMEKPWAQKAGIGWIGKHTNLIAPGHGSWFFIGVVLTDLELETDQPGTDLCGSCQLCLAACPTGALSPYSLDSRRCISYLTIEKKGDLDPALQPLMGDWIYGCDDCQDVCPWNNAPIPATEKAFLEINPHLKTLTDEPLTPSGFNEKFKKSPMKRIKAEGLNRNLAIFYKNRNHHEPVEPKL
jgi:epoxyqueuosine reductase